MRRRPSRPGLLLRGDIKRYECTLPLQPCWDVARAGGDYRQYVRHLSADWPAVAEVYRKWALNEAGQYSASPYNLPAFDVASLGGDFFLSVPRRLGPCLSVLSPGQPMGHVVELSLDSGQTWRRYGGSVRLSSQDCSLLLSDDALAADYFRAVRDDAARLRVTATVDSDCRLEVQVSGDRDCGVRLIEVPSARWAQLHSGSIFFGRSDPPPAVRDDRPRLLGLAGRYTASPDTGLEAKLKLGWLDASFNVGDLVWRVEGRNLPLQTAPGLGPCVCQVHHDCQEWTTELVIQ